MWVRAFVMTDNNLELTLREYSVTKLQYFRLETVKFASLKTYLLVSLVSAVLPLTTLHLCGTFDITLKKMSRPLTVCEFQGT